jgi:hypothetical protein
VGDTEKYMQLIRELFFKLKDHPSAVASWLAAIVSSNNECNVKKTTVMSVTNDLTNHLSKSVDGKNEKRATLEEAGDSSFLL